MRQQTSGGKYAVGTKIDAHRSRLELERLLARYGATDFVVLEHDANATIRFALHGKYVQYVLPLPEFEAAAFTHTPTGRPRTLAAHERAYEQAVRQQWRRAVLVMKGKLEAVESGLSPFEREFYGAIQDDDRREKPAALLLRRRLRWAPETMLVILCLGVLVPAGGAVALGVPAVAVEHLAAPAFGDASEPLAAGARSSRSAGDALRLSSGPPAAGEVVEGTIVSVSHSQGAGGSAGAGSAGGEEAASSGDSGASGSQPASEQPGQGNGNPDSPSQGNGNPDNPGQGSGQPDNPGQGHGQPDNPGQGHGQPDNPGQGHGQPDNPGQGHGPPANPGNGNGNGNGNGGSGPANGENGGGDGNGHAYGQDKPDGAGQGKGGGSAGAGSSQAQPPASDSQPGKSSEKGQGEQNGKGAGGPANGKN